MTIQEKLTAEFRELDRVTPRPLEHEDYAIAAIRFYQDLGDTNELEEAQRWLEIATEGLPPEGEQVLWLNKHKRIIHNSWERFTNQDADWARFSFTHWRPIDLPQIAEK